MVAARRISQARRPGNGFSIRRKGRNWFKDASTGFVNPRRMKLLPPILSLTCQLAITAKWWLTCWICRKNPSAIPWKRQLQPKCISRFLSTHAFSLAD